MKLVCQCSGTMGMDDYAYAVIYLSDPVIDWLLKKMDLAKQIKQNESSFYGLEFFDYQASYYSTLELPEDLDGEEFLKLDDTFEPGRSERPIATPTVVVTDDTVIWHGSPKHSSGHFETATLTKEFLQTLHEPDPVPA